MSDPSMPAPMYGPRPYNISENDHRGIVVTIGVLYIIYAFMILGMRLASKYNHMGMDDLLSIAATAIAVPQFGAVIAATTNGSFGSSYGLLSLGDTNTIARCMRAGDILFLLAIFVAKCSVIMLTRRLFAAQQHQKRFIYELARKLQASASFILRLPIIILIGLNIKYVSVFNTASDAGVALTSPVLLRETQLLYALFSAAVPALNQYLRKLDTTHATQFGYRTDQYGNESSGRAYELSRMPKQTGQGSMAGYSGIDDNKGSGAKSSGADFRNAGRTQYHARVDGPTLSKSHDGISSGSQEDVSVGRHGSEDHIIRKEVAYEVRNE
ncbi:hypothetical protein LTR99_009758 [Exophiala xenobiotica]|uniref:Rhodopsin domain-containing protein n=1 Tax=Vermiconidia calcicola TaxID=1690605 RepID=A0AAV9PZ05_9PEZI|nr:hypothetical protein LTR96_007114 [Exophiala xenobiotica]KAK5530597.1 hypothetical protein LTR25_009175 [Vermiconidia calcicola]KAK5532178.1 hypothetical protein LTR23_009620 [Chaetothyriales sp. CCFEE 6169]KAK5294360.1 hypothetical protein LTR99_009758 [Exophiala xenobiotica]KAK5336253.1 hypothetical protein LTR98_007583 [Exophiala xenobiotica]